MLFDTSNITIDNLKDTLFTEKEIEVSIVRLDKIHPVVSGNKLFKLHYFLEECIASSHKTVVTFGGAYSNHLVATSYACKEAGIKCTGIVRGEKPAKLSYTLEACMQYGMQLKFISRDQYAKKDSGEFIQMLSDEFGEHTLIPEGGFDIKGAMGAALITPFLQQDCTHICCAAGTATTIAGLLLSAKKEQKIIGVNVLKGITDTEKRILFLTNNANCLAQLTMINNYHFGGYAKHTPELIAFMNELYAQYQLPTDFIYTAKMLFAIFDLARKNFFEKGSKINCLHTGGLQGNRSLHTLSF